LGSHNLCGITMVRRTRTVKIAAGLISLLLSSTLPGCNSDSAYVPASGDIIFHTSRSSQSEAIQLATKSRYSHMGVVYVQDGQPVVFEAVEPVKITPLKEWAVRGDGGHFVVKRLSAASSVLSAEVLSRMFEVARGFAGKHYDAHFEWSDDRIYCSELVWKIYKRGAGLELGVLETLGDFDRSSPAVRRIMEERWGDSPPLEEVVISPVAIYESDLLVEVYRNEAP
jgi:hypothetical protein